MKDLINDLYDIGVVKFGDFTLKSGKKSPIYIDLRETISYPHILKKIAEEMWKKAKSIKFDVLCAVPYTALPFACYLSIQYDIPMVLRRKEAKDYGTKKILEGKIQPKQTCLILEDLITSGESILETILPIKEAGARIQDVIVFLDREQGGKTRLESLDLRLQSVITVTEMLDILESEKRITLEIKKNTQEFIQRNKI
jgi:uridine monophosphate synthetase